MSGFYKTPGVYVEEIPKFPPSIAAVETAIPAFIGYTQFDKLRGEDLNQRAVPINSIAEFEEIFGTAPKQKVTIELDALNNFDKATPNSAFYLYDSLRMFYANGGGKCYVVTLGAFPDSTNGLNPVPYDLAFASLEKEDEPTIIVLPDAVHLGNSGLYTVQQKALLQCGKLMDRFALCDMEKAITKNEFDSKVNDFRDKIGINNLKYAAAYGPWINASLPRTMLRRNLRIVRSGSTTPDILSSLSSDANVKSLIETIVQVEADIDGLGTFENTLSSGPANGTRKLEDEQAKRMDDYRNLVNTTNANLQTALQAFAIFLTGTLTEVRKRETNAPYPSTSFFKIKTDLEKYRANSGLETALKGLAGHHKALNSASTPKINILANDDLATLLGFPNNAAMLGDASIPDYAPRYTGAVDDKARADIAFEALAGVSVAAFNFFRFYTQTLTEYENKLNQALVESFGLYKTLVGKASDALNTIPPSGAIAGVYASTDRERGVWKAPANVSLNAVIGPAVKITSEDQTSLNVDVTAGKSINIIRSFMGKGTLVWGARTLAGNDNEWRYVNVRRLFNFVEESVKKATEQFVFEPNDANTWVKVQAMIENFLYTLWRQGALQGVKPEHAYYVAVGLGKTMTPLDILEGRMIIEIGMAAVRPAEFIILKFSHKMPES